MPLIESSKDILYIVLSFSVLLITIFLCWAIYYIARILGDAHHMITDFRKKLEILEHIMVTLREKIEQSSNYLRLLVDGAIAATQYFKSRQPEDEAAPAKKGKK